MRSAVSIQCLPLSVQNTEDAYKMVDEAIDVIAESGLPYTVGPFETTVEGELDEVWDVARQAHQAVMDAGEDDTNVLSFVKVASGPNLGSTEEKISKYRNREAN